MEQTVDSVEQKAPFKEEGCALCALGVIAAFVGVIWWVHNLIEESDARVRSPVSMDSLQRMHEACTEAKVTFSQAELSGLTNGRAQANRVYCGAINLHNRENEQRAFEAKSKEDLISDLKSKP